MRSKNHNVHWGINFPTLNNTNPPPPFICRPLNMQTAQAPLFRQSTLPYWFFMNPLPLKVRFFSEPKNINPIFFKVTKFLKSWRFAYVPYVCMPNFIGIHMNLGICTLTCTLTVQNFFWFLYHTVQKLTAIYVWTLTCLSLEETDPLQFTFVLEKPF